MRSAGATVSLTFFFSPSKIQWQVNIKGSQTAYAEKFWSCIMSISRLVINMPANLEKRKLLIEGRNQF